MLQSADCILSVTKMSSATKHCSQGPPEHEDDQHSYWMQEALKLAHQALESGEVPVGCILVHKDHGIIGTGCNHTNETKNATRHAEMVAADQVLAWSGDQGQDPKELFKECTLYVTVEPCVMCTAGLRLLEVPLAVYGCPNDRFGGCGSVMKVHEAGAPSAGPQLKCLPGYGAKEAVQLLKEFYKGENPSAPEPKKKEKRSHK